MRGLVVGLVTILLPPAEGARVTVVCTAFK